MSTEYGKTENLFTRNDETHKLNIGDFRNPYVRQIKDWLVTEKIDGTNMRVILDWAMDVDEQAWRPVIDVRGRSDNAEMPKNFVKEAFGVDEPHELTERILNALCSVLEKNLTEITAEPTMAVLYGEGYGAGIQKGAYYSPTKQFRGFDLVTYRYKDISILGEPAGYGPELSRPFWRSFDQMGDFCEALGVKTVPLLSATAPLEEIVDRIQDGLRSAVAFEESGVVYEDEADLQNNLPYAEGVVARTDPYLYDHNHSRVFFKLKGKDLE